MTKMFIKRYYKIKVILNTEELFVTNDFGMKVFTKTIFHGFEVWEAGLKISEYEAS